ncbi:putative disease resistance protein At1g50180 [Chenopodium quinoa]|uniref:Uncharacterized protein n=1 Tax=Chenopodium quinoa TaxID=63459 RepID=A0A803KWQ5_CHEQI|nr:putative disease resistance protein At1g50180 [Chenopodium quinoa]
MAEVVVSLAAENIQEDSNALISSVKSEAHALCKDLKELEKSLVDAERNSRPAMANNEQIHAWFAELRKIAHEAEDSVDSLVSGTDCTAFSSLRYPIRARRTSKKLQGLREDVNNIKSKLNNKEGSSSKKVRSVRDARHFDQQTDPDIGADEDIVVGIDADVDRLVKVLVKKKIEDDADPHLSLMNVVAIVGIGGSGKTTLAKNIYYHRKVNNHFNYKVWLTLNQDWDASHKHLLLFRIVQSIRGSNSSSGSVKKLHRVSSLPSYRGQGDSGDVSLKVLKTLQKLFRTESCLVVLDDVWDWEPFRGIIDELFQVPPTSSPGVACTSKILFTSRRLPSPAGADTHLKWVIVHETKSLSQQDSWELFKKMLSKSENGKRLDKNYPGLAMEMVGKCKGLPLSIVALGRLLTRKGSIEEWERVFSQLKGEQGSHLYGPVNDILALSYSELPHHLKPCFLYLGLLSEDSTIPAGVLKRMWIAEGFVKDQQGCKTPEVAAKDLLDELVNHTMVQIVTKTFTDKANTLRLHDMMRDICIKIGRTLDFLTLFPSYSDQLHSRRAAINLSKSAGALPNNAGLRSLMLSQKSSTSKQYGSRMNNQQGIVDLALVFEKFKLLRVLEIKGIKTYNGTMPKEIGSLIHLRYLGIRSTNIQQLPRSIGKLHKLLTLDYWDVTIDNEIRLPNVFWRLERLRHLFLPNEMMTNVMADMRFDGLRHLQTLWGIKGGEWMLTEMNKLSVSLTKLYIQGISDEAQLEAVFGSSIIKEHDNLYALCLDWYSISLKPESLSKLSSKNNLKKLRLMGRALDKPQLPLKFPDSLWKLELYYTHLEEPETLNTLGKLPNLKFLGLSKGSFTGRKWTIRKEIKFESLKELKLSSLPNLKEWEIESGTTPCLKKLSIISCMNLKQLPQGLQSIKTLETLDVRSMPTSFNRRFRDVNEGEDFHIVSRIPNVWVKDSCTHLFY